MKIAVTYSGGNVFQHFGHTPAFKIYDVENGEITASRVVDAKGSGHGALAGFLRLFGVDALICGGIGGGARDALAGAGIAVYGGVTGDADSAARSLAAGQLTYDPDARCSHHHDHHDHHDHHGHDCSDHGCKGINSGDHHHE